MAIPLLDLFSAVIRRTRARRNPFAPDKEHLHHRLLQIGHSPVRAVLLMYAWTGLLAGSAVALAFIPAAYAVGGFLLGVVILVVIVRSPRWGKSQREVGESQSPDAQSRNAHKVAEVRQLRSGSGRGSAS